MQVTAPSVTLPTPPLPPPLQEAITQPQPGAEAEATPQPTPAPAPEFNPPTAESLNLQSAQPAGNPEYGPASVTMPATQLNDAMPGSEGAEVKGTGPLGTLYDWAKKLLFQVAVRTGWDSNPNSAHTGAQASWFANVNGAVNYRFGTPRLNFNADLTGGLTQYPQLSSGTRNQGVVGLGVSVEYRYSPRMVLTFNTSSSYQQQVNPGLAGSSQNQNGSYIYTANSLAAAYQWSEKFTTVSRFNYTQNYYLQSSANNQSGFGQPGFTQSFRWLTKPTTTTVVDYNTDYYAYGQQGTSSWGNSLAGGFDHIFNPRWFWNFRLGAEFRTSQSQYNNSPYIGPYLDNNFSWAFGKASSLTWMAHFGTQPSGQSGVSYSPAFRTGLNYTQGITAKLRMNSGLFYLIQYYKDSPQGPVQANGQPGVIDYYQTSLQGNIDLLYDLNRIFQLAVGFQYLGSLCDEVPTQAYNRGIGYVQLKAAF